MMNPCSNPILFIHSANTSEVGLTNYFDDIKQPWVGVSRFADAAAQTSKHKFGMVVCDWELFQASQTDRLESLCQDTLLHDAAPMIFVSASQSVSVNFKPVRGRSFYSLKAEESSGLFAIISELASRVSNCTGVVNQDQNSEGTAKNISSAQPRTHLPAPHLSLGQNLSPALANSSVHSLY